MNYPYQFGMATAERFGYFRRTCGICGGQTEKWAFAAILYDRKPDNPGYFRDNDNVVVSEICHDCLKGGPEEAALRARKFAAYLSEKATETLMIATGIEEMPGEDWIYCDEFQKLMNEMENDTQEECPF